MPVPTSCLLEGVFMSGLLCGLEAGDEVEGAGEMVEGDETDDVEELTVGVAVAAAEVGEPVVGDGHGGPGGVRARRVGDQAAAAGSRAVPARARSMSASESPAAAGGRDVGGEAHGAPEVLFDSERDLFGQATQQTRSVSWPG